MCIIERCEFELACVREFSHSGAQLGAAVSREQRRERIRLAILEENKARTRWRDTALTYAAAYEQAYRKPFGAESIEDCREPLLPRRPRYMVPGFDLDADEEEDDEVC